LENGDLFYGHLEYFSRHLGYIYDHSVHFVFIWYIFPVLVSCIKKSLATLLRTGTNRVMADSKRLDQCFVIAADAKTIHFYERVIKLPLDADDRNAPQQGCQMAYFQTKKS
jgi:hypothetical protein